MIPKFKFWNIAEHKMYDLLSLHVMTGMAEVEGGKYFLVPQEGILMQSTGLFDKKGVEIFEGDVVRVCDEANHKVTFIRGAFCIDFPDNGTPLLVYGGNQLEVIDSIYENPKLVEVKND